MLAVRNLFLYCPDAWLWILLINFYFTYINNYKFCSCIESDPRRGKQISLERSPTEQDKCIWDQEVQCLDAFQRLLTAVLKINLDPKRELGGDYRSLAGALGKNMKYIWHLATMPSPVEELLKDCHPTLRALQKKLSSDEVGRTDVANEITAWVEKEGCCCSRCLTSLR